LSASDSPPVYSWKGLFVRAPRVEGIDAKSDKKNSESALLSAKNDERRLSLADCSLAGSRLSEAVASTDSSETSAGCSSSSVLLNPRYYLIFSREFGFVSICRICQTSYSSSFFAFSACKLVILAKSSNCSAFSKPSAAA